VPNLITFVTKKERNKNKNDRMHGMYAVPRIRGRVQPRREYTYIGVQGGRSRAGAARVSAMEPAAAEPRKLPPPTTTTPKNVESTGAPTAAAKRPPPAAAAVTTISLLAAAAGLGGAALLAWWAVSFRRAGLMLWMVPAGLVLVGTPLLAWLSVVASGPEPQQPPPPPC
jgi:hypothetical protein